MSGFRIHPQWTVEFYHKTNAGKHDPVKNLPLQIPSPQALEVAVDMARFSRFADGTDAGRLHVAYPVFHGFGPGLRTRPRNAGLPGEIAQRFIAVDKHVIDGQPLAAVAAARLAIFSETEIMATFGPDRQKGIGHVVRAMQRFCAEQCAPSN